jgi:hypothetical protein
MYCPQCGLQQVSNDVRFCSRCGFQLGGVTELLNNQGMPIHHFPANQLPFVAPPGISQRKKGMKNGARLMFLSAVLTPIFIAFSVVADHPGPFLIPFTVFLAGLCWMVFSAIFGEDTPIPQASKIPQQFGANPPPRTALPGAENYRVTGVAPPRINTSEIVNPPSVTDHTTQLFDKE